jgi:hypothetical protein
MCNRYSIRLCFTILLIATSGCSTARDNCTAPFDPIRMAALANDENWTIRELSQVWSNPGLHRREEQNLQRERFVILTAAVGASEQCLCCDMFIFKGDVESEHLISLASVRAFREVGEAVAAADAVAMALYGGNVSSNPTLDQLKHEGGLVTIRDHTRDPLSRDVHMTLEQIETQVIVRVHISFDRPTARLIEP